MTNDYSERRGDILRFVCGFAILWLAMLALPAFAQGVPSAITYQGKLTDSSGAPVADGTYSLTFRFFPAAVGGSASWISVSSVNTIGGVFTARMDVNPSIAMPGADVWIETVVGVETLAPRVKLASAPFALRAGDLNLPFAKSYSDPGSLFSLTNTGAGGAVVAVATGSGAALTAVAGTGKAAAFTGNVSVSGMADVGGFKLATGAYPGYVLTSDALGQGAWQLAGGGGGGGGGIGGAGTANYIPRWSGVSTLGNSVIYQNGSNNIGIGTTTPAAGLDVHASGVGVSGNGTTHGIDAIGSATGSTGLYAYGDKYGVYAVNNGGTNNGNCGIFAQSNTGPGVYARAFGAAGVQGVSDSGDGTYGYSSGGRGAVGVSGNGDGVLGASTNAAGGYFTSTQGSGIYAQGGYWGADIHGSQGGVIVNGGPGTGVYATGGYWGADIRGGSQGGIHASANGGPWGAVIDGGSQGGIWATGVGGLWGASITGGSEGAIVANANGGKWGADITGGLLGGIKVSGGTPNRAAQFWGNCEVIGNLNIYSTGPGTPMVAAIGEGLDYAEGFDVSSGDDAAPGTVLIIDTKNTGKLAVSRSAYDRKVAGIVAGAKGLGSGVKLGLGKYDHNVALAGRVYCNVDATRAAVEAGDLLTTSSTPGYAMKSSDYSRAQGAILGKAMESLAKGKKGQILVLVTLQ